MVIRLRWNLLSTIVQPTTSYQPIKRHSCCYWGFYRISTTSLGPKRRETALQHEDSFKSIQIYNQVRKWCSTSSEKRDEEEVTNYNLKILQCMREHRYY